MTKANSEAEEIDILKSYEQDEWKSVNRLNEEIARYQSDASAWLENNILVSLALPASDMDALKERARAAGVSQEALIADLVHQFVTGKIQMQP
jgi:predicted DNA binding CopG/RHH family protein